MKHAQIRVSRYSLFVAFSFLFIAATSQAIVAQGSPTAASPGGPSDQPAAGSPSPKQATASKVSASEGDWSFDITTSIEDRGTTKSATVTYYSGKSASVVIVPSVLGGAPVTKIASQAFGHHGEIAAVYVPEGVESVADWAFYDLNAAVAISFANPKVSIDDAAFQSSGNAVLYLPASTSQKKAGGKAIVTSGTKSVSVAIANPAKAAVSGGSYLSVESDARYAIDAAAVAAIARSASGAASDVAYKNGTLTFSGADYVARKRSATVAASLASAVAVTELSKTFRALTESGAAALNAAIAAASAYAPVSSRLRFGAGYYLNGSKVALDPKAVAYDVETGERVSRESDTGLFPSTGSGKYKYVAYRDSDGDGDIDVLYYSPFGLEYSYESVAIASPDPNLDGLKARDRLNPSYLAFASAALSASGKGSSVSKESLAVDTAKDGDRIGAAANEERSALWAHDYGSISVGQLSASSSSVGNWARMSYEAGLPAPNTEIVMEWGMNALLYATDGGRISVGSLSGPTTRLSATGDGANGIIAGGAGTEAGKTGAPSPTSSVRLLNAELSLSGWNNHVADVVYGGYACLERVTATTGLAGSYAVGQASALANDFGNGVVEAKDFHATVYGNRSAGAYVIGGGIIQASSSTFVSRMDAGLVTASGGTFRIDSSSATGQIGLRGRGGVVADSSSTIARSKLAVLRDEAGYTTGQSARRAAAAWRAARGGAAGSSELAAFRMSAAGETLGSLCDAYGISAANRKALYAELGAIAGRAYADGTALRCSVLDNSFYNYSAGAYVGTTDFSEIPYLTIGSSFGGLASSVIEFEGAGMNLIFDTCVFESSAAAPYRYLLASEAGSAPVVTFKDSKASGLIWNEGSVDRAVEGRPGTRSSSLVAKFVASSFEGSFADGSSGLWNVAGLSYANAANQASSLNGNYYGAKANWGVAASFDASSTWEVTNDSYLGKLELAQGAEVRAPEGYSLSMTLDGKPTAIKAGSYSGKIIVELKKL